MVAITRMTNKIAMTTVTQNKVFSMPRRWPNTPPESAPVRPPKLTPLLCSTTLRIKASEVIINAI